MKHAWIIYETTLYETFINILEINYYMNYFLIFLQEISCEKNCSSCPGRTIHGKNILRKLLSQTLIKTIMQKKYSVKKYT